MKKFIQSFFSVRDTLSDYIEGIADKAMRSEYAHIVMFRLTVLFFLQKNGLRDGDAFAFSSNLKARQNATNTCTYYQDFLMTVFLEKSYKIFTKHEIEKKHNIQIPNAAFENMLGLFESYSWSLDDTQNEMLTPKLLGRLVESSVDQKGTNTYYTSPKIARYLCEQTIHRFILEKVGHTSIESLLANMDIETCGKLRETLTNLTILDTACGCGAFLTAAMNTLLTIYQALVKKILQSNDEELKKWVSSIAISASLSYSIKRFIIKHNLYGVDIMPEATKTAKITMFLMLADNETKESLEPLPDIGMNIETGNALIGITSDEIEDVATLNALLLQKFNMLKIKKSDGKLAIADIEKLNPFHWRRTWTKGKGFDIIVTNPPWDLFSPDENVFFAKYHKLAGNAHIKQRDIKLNKNKILQNQEIANEWKEYKASFTVPRQYYLSDDYKHQTTVFDGQKFASKINLYKLFLERCFSLLASDGHCGIVLPHGFCSNLGLQPMRKLLLQRTQITNIVGMDNHTKAFNGLQERYEFVLLTFQKGKQTSKLPVNFTINDVRRLENLKSNEMLEVSNGLIEKLSPDSLTIMKFKDKLDIEIAQKMLRFPLLGARLENSWNVQLTCEFDMTNDSHLFCTSPGKGRLPLYEGKMIHQFNHRWAEPRYWVEEHKGRKTLLGRVQDDGQKLDYQMYRLGFRDIASNTNERTMIASILPPAFHGNKIPTVKILDGKDKVFLGNLEQLFLCAVWNSFLLDAIIRLKVTCTLNFFHVYQLPIPRLTPQSPFFQPIVRRAAKLICTTDEFDELASQAGIGSHKNAATDPTERAQLRNELDAIVSHMYGLTKVELEHVLSSFPLVNPQIKLGVVREFEKM